MSETPRIGHAPIPMRLCGKQGFWDRAKLKLGDFYWRVDDDSGKRMLCVLIPCATAESGYTFSQWTTSAMRSGHGTAMRNSRRR